jgi:predicted O-linked N-acetylglucosamine transferase (SPINDLY family)
MGERYDHDRIRLAYLSADFRDSATSRLMAGLFELHDRTRFETIAISFGPDTRDDVRLRLRNAFERFIDVRQMSNDEVVTLLREMEVDIAVDLTGHSRGARTAIFAQRAAPIQVNYLGFPGTMGADCFDYILADRYVIPSEQRTCYAESVVYLPDTFQVNDAKRHPMERTPTRMEVGLPENAFVFCSFNNNFKLNPSMFDVWMRLLREIESGALWLLGGSPAIENNLRREAAARGVAPDRLVFASRIGYEAYLARYRLADLFLDTLPFNGGATASDALWAGVPLLTCSGEAFAARMSGSLLQALGMNELVTESLGAYASAALKIAGEPSVLVGLKQKLSRNQRTFPLFDTDRFRRHIEKAFVTMWEYYQRGNAPAGFAVPLGHV